LNVVALFDQFMCSMCDHEGCEEDVNRSHNCQWDFLLNRIVAPVVQRGKNTKENILEHTVFKVSHSLKVGSSNLQAYSFLADLFRQKVLHDPHDLLRVTLHEVWVLADHCNYKLALRRH